MSPKKPASGSSSASKSRAAKSSAKPSAASAAPAPSANRGFKVQIIYVAARSQAAKAPLKDALWFATYPIIPRIGDCLFRDGVYYRVERVCLYENVAPGWCADVEVSYYGR